MKKLNQNGFHPSALGFLIAVLAVVGLVGYKVFKNQATSKDTASTSNNVANEKTAWPMDEGITWEATGQGGWITVPYEAKVPDCPSLLQLALPTTDIDQATSLLYPGQTRTGTFSGLGGNYKAHGGFRFDKATDNSISVVMPYDAYALRGSRFIEGGEVQYDFDFVNPCGIMIRLGHLLDLTPEFQALADKFPAAVAGDSRTEKILPMVPFKTGDKIATAVGFRVTKNVTFDYGVYDLRSNNEASKDASYKTAHADTAELSYHGQCWLDLLSSADEKTVKALPGAEQSGGEQSDYCE